eukprot:scaffold1658_cov393-Prasinococcus_capsulatus_cf.AAC.24
MMCGGCEAAVRRVLDKLDGVESVDINRDTNKVTVTGNVTPEKVLSLGYTRLVQLYLAVALRPDGRFEDGQGHRVLELARVGHATSAGLRAQSWPLADLLGCSECCCVIHPYACVGITGGPTALHGSQAVLRVAKGD